MGRQAPNRVHPPTQVLSARPRLPLMSVWCGLPQPCPTRHPNTLACTRNPAPPQTLNLAGRCDHRPHRPAPSWRSLLVPSCSEGRLILSALGRGRGLPPGAEARIPMWGHRAGQGPSRESCQLEGKAKAGSLMPAAPRGWDGRGDGAGLPLTPSPHPPLALTGSTRPHGASPGCSILSLLGLWADGRRWWPQEGRGRNGPCLGSRVTPGVPRGLAAIQNQPGEGAGPSLTAELGLKPRLHQSMWLQGEAG